MYQILIVDESPLDREVTRDILTSAFPDVMVQAVDSRQLNTQSTAYADTDMLLLNIPCDLSAVWDSTIALRARYPKAAILLTSLCQEEALPSLVIKCSANGYLLKPYRPSSLIAAVTPLIRAAASSTGDAVGRKRRQYLSRLSEGIKECAYKKCIEIAKEYIDSLCSSTDNNEDIRAETVSFAEGLAALGNDFSPQLRWKLTGCLERFRSRYDLQGRKYETCSLLEEMLDAMFEEMDQSACYFDDALKKVLNYIDRNIKKGITLDEAAEYVNMSSCYFSKFFKKEVGQNFITYVTDRKIEFAKDMLLNTDMPVLNIAYELSYNETNYFSKAFKKKVGVTPTEFREQGGLLSSETAVGLA